MAVKENCEYNPLCVGSFGVAFGVVEALVMLVLGWSGWLFHYGVGMVHQLAPIYHGFGPTFVGGIVGAIWGFVVGLIFGLLVAWIYNFCNRKCAAWCKKNNK